MAYTRINFEARDTQYQNRFDVVNNADGSITLIPKEGTVYDDGVPFTPENMNHMDQGIKDAHDNVDNLSQNVNSNKNKIENNNRNLTQLMAYADIDNRAIPNSGKFYDLLDGTSMQYSTGVLNKNVAKITSALSAGETNIPIDAADITKFEAGQEVTIYGVDYDNAEAVTIENTIIQSIDDVGNNLVVNSLQNAYPSNMSIVGRSIIGLDAVDKRLNFTGKIFDYIGDLKQHFNPNDEEYSDCKFSRDGSMVAFGTSDAVKIYNTSDMSLVTTLDMTSTTRAISWSSDGTKIAAGDRNDTLRMFNTSDWSQEWSVTESDQICDIAFSPDSAYIAVTSYVFGNPVRIYNTSGSNIKTIAQSDTRCYAVDYKVINDTTYLACGYHHLSQTKIYDTSDWSVYKTIENSAYDIEISPNGTLIAIGAKIYNISTGELVASLEISDDNYISYNGISFSPDGKYFAYALPNNGGVFIYNAETWEQIAHKDIDGYEFIEFTPDSLELYTKPSGFGADIWTITYPISPSNLITTYVRYDITPYTTMDEIVAWIEHDTGLTVDGDISIVSSDSDESYNSLTKEVTTLENNQEESQLDYSTASANSKVTLKLTLTRASTSDDVAITKVLGAID